MYGWTCLAMLMALYGAACSEPQSQPPAVPAALSRPPIRATPVKPTVSPVRYIFPPQTQVRRDAPLGTISHLKAPNLSQYVEQDPDFRRLQTEKQFAELAQTFIQAYRSEFRLQQPVQELRLGSVKTDDLGLTHVRMQQIFQNIPVWAAELIVHLDKAAHVYLVQGRYLPTPQKISTTPNLTRNQAVERVAQELGISTADCGSCTAKLVIFAQDFAIDGHAPRLAYQVHASPSLIEGWDVMVDAETGTILQKLPTVVRTQ